MIQRVTIRNKKNGEIIYEIKVLKAGIEQKILNSFMGDVDVIEIEVRDEKRRKVYFAKGGVGK